MQAKESNVIINTSLYPINPVQCGIEKCAASHSFGPVSRSFWLLHFVVSGKGIFKTKAGQYSLKEGEVFIVRPNEVTYYEADAQDPWEYIWIGYKSKIEMPKAMTTNDVIYAPYLKDAFMDAKFTEIYKSGGDSGAYEKYLCGKIWCITALIMANDTKALDDYNYAKIAVSIIESEYSDNLTVNTIAERLHLSRTYFCKVFKNAMGVSAHKYLTDFRMNKALKMLTNKNLTISVIALSVGYSDVFAFSRAFHTYFGMSPSQKRALLLEQDVATNGL